MALAAWATSDGTWCRTSLGLGFLQAVALTLAATLLSGLWLHQWGRRLRPGVGRLLVVVPVACVNVLLPLLFCHFEDALTAILVSFNITWLSSFKAISWALDRGALCMFPFTPSQFLAVYIAPITPSGVNGLAAPKGAAPRGPAPTPSESSAPSEGPAGSTAEGPLLRRKAAAGAAAGAAASGDAGDSGGAGQTAAAAVAEQQQAARLRSKGRLEEDAGGWWGMMVNEGAKLAFIGFIAWVLQHPLPAWIESFACGMALYALLSLIMDGPAALIIGLTGLRVSPHFDRPWLSTSVASFWSKRWDLAAGNTLRQLIYDSICDGRLLPPPPGTPHRRPGPGRQALGTFASFATSGLVHEGIFWYMTGHTSYGVWFSFFLVQAPLIVLERLALAALKRRNVRLPTWARNAYTVLLVVYTGQALFWPPCKRYGVLDAALGNVAAFFADAGAAVQRALA